MNTFFFFIVKFSAALRKPFLTDERNRLVRTLYSEVRDALSLLLRSASVCVPIRAAETSFSLFDILALIFFSR